MRPELLTMLTTRTVRLEGGFGGIPSLTPADVAAMLSRCSDFQFYLITGKYADDHTARHRAWALWFMRCMEMGWHLVPGRVERFASTTLAEYYDPCTCVACNGVGSTLVDTRVVVCESCHGQQIGRAHV